MLTSEFIGSFDGTIVHYQIHRGEKTPTLVFIHGAGSNHTTWNKITPLFPDRQYVIVDLRNHGLSGFGKFSIEHAARDVAEVLVRENIRDFIPVGMSVGTQVAVELAKKFPGRVRKLILASPASRSLVNGSAWWAAIMKVIRGLSVFLPLRRKLKLTQNEAVSSFISPFYSLRGMHLRDLTYAIECSLRAPLDVANVKVPTLLITGKFDTLLNHDEIRRLVKQKNIKWWELPTHHLVLTRAPKKCAEAIKWFIGD
ncbi:MAG: alpha/beta hydrolase [Nanoarchaeota archaeon]